MIDKNIWGIHTQNEYMFLNNNVVGLQKNKLGDLSSVNADRESFKCVYLEKYPDKKNNQLQIVQVCFIDLFMR